MKNPLDRDDFEIFLGDEVNQHRMYPSDHVWRNIQQEIHGHKKWPALGVITLFVISALVVGTVLIKPQRQAEAIANEQVSAVKKQADVISKQPVAADPVQEQFSPEHITQQTIARVNADFDLTDNNIQSGLTAYNTNFEFVPANYPVATTQENDGAAETLQTTPVSTSPAISFVTGTKADIKEAKKETVAQVKANPFINWLSLIPSGNLNYNGQLVLNIPGITTKQHKATGNGFMFSLLGKSQSGALSLENNFTEPVRKPFSLKPKSRRFDFAFYATPSVSYRNLVYAQKSPDTKYISGIPYNADYKVDLSRAIRNKPSIGYEVGAAIGYKLNKILTLRGGFQFNMREYDIVAYKQNSSVSSFSTFPTQIAGGLDVSNQTSATINSDKVVLQNRYYEISMPLGIDVTAWKSGRFGLGAAAAIQPTYTFDKDPFIITSDYKNYIDGSKLVRNWNVNGNFETYFSYATGQFKWQIGPQFRYQILSTLSGGYPTKQHLLDYGLKIGFVKSLP